MRREFDGTGLEAAIDDVRADCWALMSSLLLAPPSLEVLDAMARAEGPDGDDLCARAGRALFAAARMHSHGDIARAHAVIFAAGSGAGVELRAARWRPGVATTALLLDSKALGFRRPRGTREPADHLGAVFRSMSTLVRSGDHASQQRFVGQHLLPWIVPAMARLRGVAGAAVFETMVDHTAVRATGSAFYVALADFVLAFVDHEADVLGIEEQAGDA